MRKVLILKNKKETNIMKNINGCDIFNYYIINDTNFIYKVLKKIGLLKLIFYKNWKKNIKEYDVAILYSWGYCNQVTKYIKKNNPNCIINLWMWNPCNAKRVNLLRMDSNIDKIWTYDKDGALKYNLLYNTQIYNKNIKLPKKDEKYDIVFLGLNKNRDMQINKYYEIFQELRLNCNIKIVNKIKDLVSYDKYLDFISDGKVLLDIVNDNVTGITLRVMEGLFFRKKVITNNKTISSYDFYNENNFFILGIDNTNNLKEFINSEYKVIDQKIIENYDVENWIKRFLK